MKEGWEVKPLGDVCNVIGGGTPSKSNGSFFSGNIPWATVRDMKFDVISETEFKITEDAVANSSTNIIPKNNVIIATRVGLGKVCFIDQNTAINQDLKAVIPKNGKKLSEIYLYWWLKSIAHLIQAEGTGATVKGVKLPFVKSLQIPTPPLPEQKRIVAILDEAFAGIEAATANAEKNLKNARELFESTLNSVFTEKGEGWIEKKLEDVCNVVGGGTPSKSNELFYTGNIAWATVRDMKSDVIANTEFKITEEALLNSSTNVIPKNNVIIATRVGLGKVCFIEQDTAINQDLRGVIPKNSTQISVMFLYWWFKSISHLIEAEGTGATVKGVKLPFIKSLPLPLLSLFEQKQIVAKLDGLSTETKHLEIIYQRKLDVLVELKQSILQKAFAGELTAGAPKIMKESAA